MQDGSAIAKNEFENYKIVQTKTKTKNKTKQKIKMLLTKYVADPMSWTNEETQG